MKKKILLIGGSLNQTTIMHQIGSKLEDKYDCYYSPFYADGFINFLAKRGLLDFTILGGEFNKKTVEYLAANNLRIDYRGTNNNYDLVFTSQDLIVPKNIRTKKLILVQEGMTDPENLFYYLAKYFGFPRWLASTSTTGLSHQYDYFCVASEGYKDLFIKKGVEPDKLIVTGLPNFDNAKQHLQNDFPYKNYVLAATSDARETFKLENRKKFIYDVLQIADGRDVIFKLHPNENWTRAEKEINKYAPKALVFKQANTNHLIANCDVLVTIYSSVVYIGMALGKEVYAKFDLEQLRKMTPIQNDGKSAEKIAQIGEYLIQHEKEKIPLTTEKLKLIGA
jgi:hypothetical protein